MTIFRGCGTALVTPFTRQGALDLEALRRLADWQIAEGINFLVACGSTGEAQTMTDEERLTVVGTVIEAARGRVAVVAGATNNDTAKAVRETKAMCDLGVDAILSAAPYYNKPTQPGLERHFTAIADAATKPIILYNVPSRSAVNISAGTTVKLAQHPNVKAIKEASADMAQVLRILRDRPPGFAVLSGDDTMTLPIIACGGEGVISVSSNQVPRAMTEMVTHALAGRLPEARAQNGRLLALMDGNFLETNPSPVKCGLWLMGMIENVVRLPLVPVTDPTKLAVANLLQKLDVPLVNQ